jgi:hypothetical protein
MIRRSLLLASLALLACAEEEPLHTPACSSAAAPVELLSSRSLSNLAPASDGVVLAQVREVSPMKLERTLRRIDPAGNAVELAPFDGWLSSSNLLVAGDDIFWTERTISPALARIETFTVPLAGGQPRPIALLNIDWSVGGVHEATPFAADAAAIYVTIRQYGGEAGSETDLYRISRADGSSRLLAHASHDVATAQLVDGRIWWTEWYDDAHVFRVSPEGPPTVEAVPVRDCLALRVTAAHGLFCARSGTLARYELDGRNRQVLVDDSNGSLEPFADDGNWLWLRASNGDVWRLDVVDRKLESVVCGRIHGYGMALGPRDLFWIEDDASQSNRSKLWRVER